MRKGDGASLAFEDLHYWPDDVFYIIVMYLRHQLIMLGILVTVITSFQMRAARALLGIDQKTLAELAGVSLPTIQGWKPRPAMSAAWWNR